MLLAGVALLCFLLPLALGTAAEAALSRGVEFSGFTLAITAPEGDPVPQQLAKILPGMSDVRQYCQVAAMGKEEALDALEAGEVTAVLALPADFIRGVMNGTNPDVELIVRGDSPLDALLTCWVGQSAADMLAAFQSGIYAVLDLYETNPPAGMSYADAVAQINLRYVSWMMNRQKLFRTELVTATDQLSVGLHYGLSLLAYLGLSLAPFFMAVYDSGWIVPQRRFRTAGRGALCCYGAAMSACWVVTAVLFAAAQLVFVKGDMVQTLLSAALCGLFCAAFGSFWCLLSRDTGSCGLVSFGCALAFLGLSGGIAPPVLLPGKLRQLMGLWPVTWLRELMAWPLGDSELKMSTLALTGAASVILMILGWLLYRRRMDEEVHAT